MRGIAERTNSMQEMLSRFGDALSAQIRVAIPGIVQSVNWDEQTVTVQPALREQVRAQDGTLSWVALPVLPDVPIAFPSVAGFALTMPVQVDDECLVIFADSQIDYAWTNGGIQNRTDFRRHDLSDAFCIPCSWTQKNKIGSIATDAAQLRTRDGGTYISVKQGEIDLVGAVIKKNGVAF